MNFECHITIPLAGAAFGEDVAAQLHWKTSQIERDPVLGKESFFYLTTHDSDYMRLFDRMRRAVFTLESAGCRVLREKIELIMYDTKTRKLKESTFS